MGGGERLNRRGYVYTHTHTHTHTHTQLIHFVVQQKLTQHYKAVMLQLKKRITLKHALSYVK